MNDKLWNKSFHIRNTKELKDAGLTDAGSIRESALLGVSVKGYLNEIQAYADRTHGGDLAKALSVLVERVEKGDE